MGSSVSTVNSDQKVSVKAFKEKIGWYVNTLTCGTALPATDEDIEEYLKNLSPSVVEYLTNSTEREGGKEDHIRPPEENNGVVPISIPVSVPTQQSVELFEDSSYHRSWMTTKEADALFQHLKEVGEKQRPRETETSSASMKYPLWTLYYGSKRSKDNAYALDRWGSYHESWLRLQDPSPEILACCEKIRQHYRLDSTDVNSIVVNYYFDGDTTYIPAHRDTVACLKEDSSIFCLSLGATRSFLLVDNDNSGEYIYENMKIYKEWKVAHGDMFALGQTTNENYCHAVPKEPALKSMRISVIFRTVSKSFVNLHGPPKEALYASGKTKTFTAELLQTEGFDDEGICEHVADLITERERIKKELMEKKKELCANKNTSVVDGVVVSTNIDGNNEFEQTPIATPVVKMLTFEDNRKYFMGAGSTVPSPSGSGTPSAVASQRASVAKGKVSTLVPIESGVDLVSLEAAGLELEHQRQKIPLQA